MNTQNPKEKLDRAITALRDQQPGTETTDAASQRVWQRLGEAAQAGALTSAVESIHGCEDVRVLLPQYRSGRLSPAKTLLVKDHLSECAACRREAEKGDSAKLLPWNRNLSQTTKTPFRWAVAVAVAVLIGVGGYLLNEKFAVPAGARARVESVDGALYKVSASGEQPLHVGEEVGEGEKVRTPGGAHAVLRLRDDSLVEMNERAEFSVSLRSKDTTIHLDRGDVIVQAAKRRTGHLYVAAPDCTVSVTGTVFSVNSGLKGSRVSVIEGEVRVAKDGATSVLHPGDQLSTTHSVAAVPMRDEISWSKDRDKFLALLTEFHQFSKKLEAVQLPGLRYQSHILPALPQSTVLFVSVPNYADALQQANKLFQQELQTSPVLRDWWAQVNHGQQHGPDLQQIIDKVHDFGQYLGNEIVLSIAGDKAHPSFLLAAEVSKPGLKEFIEQQLPHSEGKASPVRVLDEQQLASASEPSKGKKEALILVRSDLVVAAANLADLRAFNAQLQQGPSGFASSPFGQRLNESYTEGAGVLLGADLQRMSSHLQAEIKKDEEKQAFESTGFADIRYLIVESKDSGGQIFNRAELSFTGPRHGIASWLAAPAPMGSLDFVSPDAGFVTSLVAKKPGQILNDVMEMITASGNNAEIGLAMAESELKIKPREDFVNTLGGEITIALDGPLVPIPSVKLILEVNDPARLQETIRQIAAHVSGEMKSGPKVSLEQQAENGLTYYTLHVPVTGRDIDINYTFTDGYMIIGPSRALVMDAVRMHQGGNSLAKSAAFHKLLPQDPNTNVSALAYQNAGPLLGPLAQQLTPSQLQAFQQLALDSKPSVVCVYGEDSAIRMASNMHFFDVNALALTSLLHSQESHSERKRVYHTAPKVRK